MNFRIYFVDARGRISLGEAFTCADEAQALERLNGVERPAAQAAELWRGGRLVGRIPHDGSDQD
jgi:hypothetical protein